MSFRLLFKASISNVASILNPYSFAHCASPQTISIPDGVENLTKTTVIGCKTPLEKSVENPNDWLRIRFDN